MEKNNNRSNKTEEEAMRSHVGKQLEEKKSIQPISDELKLEIDENIFSDFENILLYGDVGKYVVSKYLTIFDFSILSRVSKKLATAMLEKINSHTNKQLLLFVLDRSIAGNNGFPDEKEMSNKNASAKMIAEKIKYPLSCYLEKIKKSFITETITHHPARTVGFHGDFFTYDAWDEYDSRLNITKLNVNFFINSPARYLLNSPPAWIFLGKENEEKLIWLKQIRQLLDLYMHVSNNDMDSMRKVMNRDNSLTYLNNQLILSYFSENPAIVRPLDLAISKNNKPMITYLLGLGILLEKHHIENIIKNLTKNFILETLPESIIAAQLTSAFPSKWNNRTIKIVAQFENFKECLYQKILAEKDKNQLVLLQAGSDKNKETLLSKLFHVSRGIMYIFKDRDLLKSIHETCQQLKNKPAVASTKPKELLFSGASSLFFQKSNNSSEETKETEKLLSQIQHM